MIESTSGVSSSRSLAPVRPCQTMKDKKLSRKDFDYIYSRVPRLCVDIILQTNKGILLTKRSIEPYKGMWHIPGGTVLKGETVEGAVIRIAKKELGITPKIERLIDFIEIPCMKN